MKIFSYLLLLIGTFILCVAMASCSPTPPSQAIVLNVGAAGMTRGALEEIDDVYEKKQPHVVINYTFAGSGTIQNAVERGEKFDLLIMASAKPIDQLQAAGRILPESRKNLLTTDVAIIVPANSNLSINNFQDLTSDRVKKIAIGTHRTAIGNYTQEICHHLGIYPQIQSKAAWANFDVREILRNVESGEVDAGITFLPEAKLSSNVKVAAIASKSYYQPVTAVGAIPRDSLQIKAAAAFLDFLTTPPAVEVFNQFGIQTLP